MKRTEDLLRGPWDILTTATFDYAGPRRKREKEST